ncbi:MAG: O-linked N-acetylglucosamine transferase, SPINDLY family protein [Cyanobacteria bacterium P01_F01_bin.150]
MTSNPLADHRYSILEEKILDQSYDFVTHNCQLWLEQEPENDRFCYYVGLALLLQGEPEEAQAVWLLRLTEQEADTVDEFSESLIVFLDQAALKHESQKRIEATWAIRRCIRDLQPDHLNNTLAEIRLSIQTSRANFKSLENIEWIAWLETLDKHEQRNIETSSLQATVVTLLENAPLESITHQLTKFSFSIIGDAPGFEKYLVDRCLAIYNDFGRPDLVAYLLQSYCEKYPDAYEPLLRLSAIFNRLKEYEQGAKIAQRLYQLSPTIVDQAIVNYQWIYNLLYCGGKWEEAKQRSTVQDALLNRLINEGTSNSLMSRSNEPPDTEQSRSFGLRLTTLTYSNAYLRDNLKLNRHFQNGIYSLSYEELSTYKRLKGLNASLQQRAPQIVSSKGTLSKKVLKIGYISHCFGCHSVGWLARWLIKYHDRDRYQIYGYVMLPRDRDPLQEWYLKTFDQVRLFPTQVANDLATVFQQIVEDGIDILVDLDSYTLGLTCAVLALKPAPIQVSWLGCDAPGLPTIDYFIADPYVLPDWAQEHYLEKIWRLPHTYIAVQGFELGVPTLRRDTLNIPDNAIVYFSGQAGLKRNPRFMLLQLKILASVPDSHLVIAGLSDQESLRDHMHSIAEHAGVDQKRLHFLERAASEAIHRANLTLMDIALDTYPYNGATTTLELLWVGVPVVTRVGEQFTARNSYTMMVNTGIEEGIAWTDEEYIEWGIRFGMEPALRQTVRWKLHQSKQYSPLWNVTKFTKDLESAYQQMWKTYSQKQGLWEE